MTRKSYATLYYDAIEERDAAENALRELRENTLLQLGLNPVDVADGMEDASIRHVIGGLLERVAELEAQLAAQSR